MSTSWDVRCADCRVNAGQDLSKHSVHVLLRIASDWLAFHDRCRALDVCPYVDFDGVTPNTDFLLEHRGHRLVARDDYGGVWEVIPKSERLKWLEDVTENRRT